ncbi:hypothetical protein BT93_K1835 [Corymbia citriodora subsp. variegata]|nr:hypothetical protein BT93_K1835 [Corymbia citriodora subsp. variegata]
MMLHFPHPEKLKTKGKGIFHRICRSFRVADWEEFDVNGVFCLLTMFFNRVSSVEKIQHPFPALVWRRDIENTSDFFLTSRGQYTREVALFFLVV